MQSTTVTRHLDSVKFDLYGNRNTQPAEDALPCLLRRSTTLENAIAHVKLNRPDALNAMNVDFWHELPAAIREIDAAGQARVIVLSSTGKHFSAGMDLGVFTNPKKSATGR